MEPQDPNVVLAFDELDRASNSHRRLLAAIEVAVLFVLFTNGRVGEPEGRNVNKGGVAEQGPTDDLYASVILTNLAATSSKVLLMANLTLSGWLCGE